MLRATVSLVLGEVCSHVYHMMPAFGLAGSSLEMENVTERDPVTVQRERR